MEAQTSAWMVQLEGEEFDMQLIEELFRSSACSVTKCDERYSLRSTDFDALSEAGEVKERAVELLRLINGIAKLQARNARPITFSGCIERWEGEKHKSVFIFPPPIEIRSRARADLTVNGGWNDPFADKPTDGERWLATANDNARVAKVLRHLSVHPVDWDELYKAYEAVEEDAGGERELKRLNWMSSGDIDRFRSTANNVRVLGDAARHGHTKFEPPRNPMSLEEAETTIRVLVKNWFNTK